MSRHLQNAKSLSELSTEHFQPGLVILISGHTNHQEYLHCKPGHLGHLAVLLHHAPHPGGLAHQVLGPGPEHGEVI